MKIFCLYEFRLVFCILCALFIFVQCCETGFSFFWISIFFQGLIFFSRFVFVFVSLRYFYACWAIDNYVFINFMLYTQVRLQISMKFFLFVIYYTVQCKLVAVKKKFEQNLHRHKKAKPYTANFLYDINCNGWTCCTRRFQLSFDSFIRYQMHLYSQRLNWSHCCILDIN